MKDFRDLKVWEKAHQLTLSAYEAIASFPKEELYGVTSQIRRCAVSIAANIAEACGKRVRIPVKRMLAALVRKGRSRSVRWLNADR